MADRQSGRTQSEHGRNEPGQNRPKSRRGRMQPRLTPMIDVTFQLLIYFVLVTTFRVAEGQIPGNLPAGPTNPGDAPRIESVTLRLIPSGRNLNRVEFALDRAEPTDRPSQLRRQLVDRRRGIGDGARLRIVAPASVAWQHVTEAYNQAVAAGWETVGIAGPNRSAADVSYE